MSKPIDGLRVGEHYTRPQLQDILGVAEWLRGGNWNTGYHQHRGDWFVFAGVGTPGRTGHDYGNHWDEHGQLVWRGRTGSALSQPAIQSLLRQGAHVFTRESDRDPFTYRGVGKVVRTEDTVPVTVVWRFS